MNYDHHYHAGHFSDVFKHVVYMILLQHLQQKEKGYCVLDTHAAYPFYDLYGAKARKTKEAEEGILSLLQVKSWPGIIAPYFHRVQRFNESMIKKTPQEPNTLHFYYPGSAVIAAMMARPQDRVVLTEWADAPYHALKKYFSSYPQVACHHQDAYQALNALLPPKERRGVVLIDPPYENTDEFETIIQGLKTALHRWPQGIYAVWYPIKSPALVTRFLARVARVCPVPQRHFDFCPYPMDVEQRLSGCGMLILNPPWKVEQAIAEVIQTLRGHFK